MFRGWYEGLFVWFGNESEDLAAYEEEGDGCPEEFFPEWDLLSLLV